MTSSQQIRDTVKTVIFDHFNRPELGHELDALPDDTPLRKLEPDVYDLGEIGLALDERLDVDASDIDPDDSVTTLCARLSQRVTEAEELAGQHVEPLYREAAT